jgi:hypothetical protein
MRVISEYYFRTDIENGLRALDQATAAALAADMRVAEVRLYRQAYRDALAAVALLFNVALENDRRELTGGDA